MDSLNLVPGPGGADVLYSCASDWPSGARAGDPMVIVRQAWSSAELVWCLRRYLDTVDEEGKQLRKPLPTTFQPTDLTLEQAVGVLRNTDVQLGTHAETGLPILYKLGRFGAYYEHGALRFSAGPRLPDYFQPTLEHAEQRLAMKAKKLGLSHAEAAAATIQKNPRKYVFVPAQSGKSAKARGSSGGPGTKPYHAWIAAYRAEHGVDLVTARAAYAELSQEERDAWKQAWIAENM